MLDFTRARASLEMIHEIPVNDYGHDTEKNELAILEHLGLTPVLGLLPFGLLEVLHLELSYGPSHVDPACTPEVAKDHLRLLACIILLRNVAFVSSDDPNENIPSFVASVIRLVRSSIALGSETSRLALRDGLRVAKLPI